METSTFSQGVHLVEISCATCVSTYSLSDVAQRVSAKLNIPLTQLPLDENIHGIAEKWGVTQVPALVIIEQGEVVGKVQGYQPEEILELYIQAKLKTKEEH